MADAESTRAPSVPQQVDAGIFAKQSTTLADIKAAGWRIDRSMSGRWWFRTKARDEYKPPEWVLEIIQDAINAGERHVQQAMRAALGLKVRETDGGAE